ncbi:MAG: GGDEF domain-containing protein [Lachnospiraceae bacterium]|nr:GGDEF domain-containing protein [Lachnospiraceae bacterium]
MAKSKTQVIIMCISICLFLAFAVTTFLAPEIVYDSISTVLSLFILLNILLALKHANRYVRCGQMLAGAVGSWLIADVLWLIYNNFHEDDLLISVSDQLFSLPVDFIFFAFIVYLRRDYTSTVFSRFVINAFMLTSIFSMLIYKSGMEKYIKLNALDFESVKEIINMLMVLFTVCAMFSIFSASGFKGHTKGGLVVAVGTLIYVLLDIRMLYQQVIGGQDESIYADIVYSFSLLLISIGYNDWKIGVRDITNDVKVIDIAKAIRVMWLNSAMVFIVAFGLMIAGIFSFTEFLFMSMTVLVYVVMYKSVQTTELINQLLSNETSEKERLEKLVEEKTKELQGVNNYLEMVSNTDELTGLHNRRYGMSFVDNLTREDLNYPFALYSLDLNFFKPINDNYGHDMGDLVLKEVAKRLKSIPYERCTAFRIGGDEFIVVYNAIDDAESVVYVANKICEMLDEPIECVDKKDYAEHTHHTFTISASVGVAVYPDDTKDIDTLFIYADKAMYSIKHKSAKSAYKFYKDLPEDER